jgi:hypothetical protein
VLVRSLSVRDPDERLLRAVLAIGSQIGSSCGAGRRKHWNHAQQQRLIAEFGQQAFANTALGAAAGARLVTDTLKTDYCQVLSWPPTQRARLQGRVRWPEDWVGPRTVAVLRQPPGGHHARRGANRRGLRHGERCAAFGLLDLGIASGVQVPILGSKGAYGLLGASPGRRGAWEDGVVFLRHRQYRRRRSSARTPRAAGAPGAIRHRPSLPNRYLFRDRLEQALTLARRNDWVVGVLFEISIASAVNDTYGHSAGDRLLLQTAARLKES